LVTAVARLILPLGEAPKEIKGFKLYIDYFTRAKTYDALKKSGKPYRKDTEMEVLS